MTSRFARSRSGPTLPAVLARAKEQTDPELRKAIDQLHPQLRLVASYHLGWLEPDGSPAAGSGGKAVRPALCLLSAQAAHAPPERGLPGAVAVELTHNFSILHDDIMDGDRERRHRPAAWSLFGQATAILAGDALFALAAEVLLAAGSLDGVRALSCLTTATTELIRGQAEDLDFEQRLDVSLDECLSMCAGKTGALMTCAASIGAVLAGGPEQTVQALAGYGRHLGLAFQAVDDLLGIWGRPETTGKPAANDLRQRKKSLPVVVALTRPDVAGDLRTILRQDELSEDDVSRGMALLGRAGARAAVNELADRELRAAIAALDRARLERRARRELRDLAAFVTRRKF